MKQRDLETHTTVLGWLYILSNGFVLLIGLLGWLLMTGLGLFAGVDSGEPAAIAVLTIIGTVGLLFFGILAVPGIVAGYGLLKRKAWGRILALVVGILGLLNFPIGTCIGIYTLWVLLQEDASDYFSSLKTA